MEPQERALYEKNREGGGDEPSSSHNIVQLYYLYYSLLQHFANNDFLFLLQNPFFPNPQ